MNAEILAVGSELLTPHFQDTNSLFLTDRLNLLGIAVVGKSIAGDNLKSLAARIRHALERTDLLVITGGLGPTRDDLTREAVAQALGVTLQRDPGILTHLYTRAAERRMPMPENNAQQADVIEGANILPNKIGSAPAQWIDTVLGGHRKILILLPGVPREMREIFTTQCEPRLREIIPLRHFAVRTLRMALIGESAADQRASPIYTRYPDVETTILAHAGEIHLHFRASAPTAAAAQARVDEVANLVDEEMGDVVFSTGEETLEQTVLMFLELCRQTLSVAESCTGGLIAERLTSVSGSSRSFLGGAVVYNDAMKTKLAGVPAELLATHGAVSKEVARALAEGIREQTGSSLGIGVTGIAGPTGGSEEKPVGLVYVALAGSGKTQVKESHFHGDRERVRWLASQQALDMVRRRLM